MRKIYLCSIETVPSQMVLRTPVRIVKGNIIKISMLEIEKVYVSIAITIIKKSVMMMIIS